MHVEVARVPARLARAPGGCRSARAGRARRRTPGRRRSSISTRQPTLPSASPSDCGITAATPSSAAQRPGRIAPGQEAARGLAGRLDARLGDVVGLAREALGREGHVGVARAAPAAELARAPDAVAPVERLVQPEVERVAAGCRTRAGPSSTSRAPRSCPAARRTAPSRSSCSSSVPNSPVITLSGVIARPAAGSGQWRRLRRRGRGQQEQRDECGAEHSGDPNPVRAPDVPGT